jgi:predicted transcriptional regulator of viral defense system
MTTMTAAVSAEHELMKLRDEYLSMPGMCLNIQQAARLMGVDPECATHLLDELEAEGLLRRADGGIYRRSSPLMS